MQTTLVKRPDGQHDLQFADKNSYSMHPASRYLAASLRGHAGRAASRRVLILLGISHVGLLLKHEVWSMVTIMWRSTKNIKKVICLTVVNCQLSSAVHQLSIIIIISTH